MNHLGYLAAAYSIIFVAIGLYALFIGWRQSTLEATIVELENELRNKTEAHLRPQESRPR